MLRGGSPKGQPKRTTEGNGITRCKPWLGLALLLASACADLGADYGYEGVQRVVAGPYRVRSVFWLKEAPIVLASAVGEDGRPEMHLVSLTGGTPCLAGSLRTYLAAVDERGFRLALTDHDDTLTFYDERCRSHAPQVKRVHDLRVLIYRGRYVYLVQTHDGELIQVDPFDESMTAVTSNVEDLSSSSLTVAPERPFAIWVQKRDGELALRKLDGTLFGPVFENVSSFVLRSGVIEDGDPVEILATVEAGEVVTRKLRQTPTGITTAVLGSWEGACRPRMLALGDLGCDDDCLDASAEQALDASSLPWLGVESPCGSGDLLLATSDFERSLPVIEGAAGNSVVVPSPNDGPHLIYNRELDSGENATFVLALDETRGGQWKPRQVGVPLDLDSLTAAVAGEYRAVSTEASPRYGSLDLEGNFAPTFEGVRDVDGTLVLHDFKDGVGRLSHCGFARCDELATGVPEERFRRYTTLPRVGETMTVFAYVRSFDAARGSGTLSVYSPELGSRVDIDRDVTNFLTVESGPIRGIVYSVQAGDRGGIWFAPR